MGRRGEGVLVGHRLRGRPRADHADPAGPARGDRAAGGREDHLDHRDVVPLAGVAQHRRARGVAGDHQRLHALRVEVVEALEGVLADLRDRLGAVGLARGVAQVVHRLVRQLVDDRPGHGEAAETGVEDPDRGVDGRSDGWHDQQGYASYRLTAPCRRARHVATSFADCGDRRALAGGRWNRGGRPQRAPGAGAQGQGSRGGCPPRPAGAHRQRPAAGPHGRLRLGDRAPTPTPGRTSCSASTATSRSRSTPNYEQFLSMVHPDDRERIRAIHQQAYATGEPYEMIERIVRPDGEVRYLSSNGQVVTDETGTPVRMRGTCIDITERVHAEDGARGARRPRPRGADPPAGGPRDQRLGRPGADRRALRPGARRHRRGARLRAPHPRLRPRDHHRPGRPGRGAGRPRRPGPQLPVDPERLTWSACQDPDQSRRTASPSVSRSSVASTSAASNACPGAMAPAPRWRPSRSRIAPSTTIGAVTA